MWFLLLLFVCLGGFWFFVGFFVGLLLLFFFGGVSMPIPRDTVPFEYGGSDLMEPYSKFLRICPGLSSCI